MKVHNLQEQKDKNKQMLDALMSESNAKEKEIEILRKQVMHETNMLNGYNNDIEQH